MKRVVSLPLLALLLGPFLPFALLAQNVKTAGAPKTELRSRPFNTFGILSLGRGEGRALQDYRVHVFEQHYDYRKISVHYHDVSLVGIWGELALVNPGTKDSALLRFSPWIESTAGLAACEVARRSRSADFEVREGTHLRFWRALDWKRSAKAGAIALPRDVVWVLEARSSSSGHRVAVLDSVGFFQQQAGEDVSSLASFGMNPDKEDGGQYVDVPLRGIAPGTVYLVWRLVIPGAAEERCSISDVQLFDVRYAENVERSPSAKR